jgi:hypothetical protein
MYKSIITIVLALMIAIATPAAALDLYLGQDTYGPETWFDKRTYHESHPGSSIQDMRDGWYAGCTVINPAKAALIEYALLQTSPSFDNSELRIFVDKPAVYPWMDEMNADFGTWLGHPASVGDNITFTMVATDGSPVRFIDHDGVTPLDLSSLTLKREALVVPTPDVKHMRILKSGELRLKVKIPYDLRDSHIRMRVMNADNTGLEYQEKIYPPYEIVKKDDTIIPDKIKITVPAEFQGRVARVELRVFESDGYMLRGMQYVTLPSLEEEVE